MQTIKGLGQCPVYLCFLIGCMMSCNRISNDAVMDFIPGTYERQINNEYSKGRDELVILQQLGNVYTIKKRSAVVRIRHGVEMPVKHDTAVWTGIYDGKDQVIREQQRGRIISFLPEENKLLVGASVYRKLK